MRKLPLLVVLVLCTAVPAGAQVSVDLHALEALPAHPGPASRPAARPLRPKVTLAPAAVVPQVATPQATPAAIAELPTGPLPPATPPAAPLGATPLAAPIAATPAAPPIASAQTASAQPPQPAPEAPKQAAANLRIPFAVDQTDLNKEGAAALEGLLHAAYEGGPPAFTIVAYAAGTPEDPSSARRISLARAMAARNALMNEGVPSRRITVRALGSQAAGGPPDRVDISAIPSTTP